MSQIALAGLTNEEIRDEIGKLSGGVKPGPVTDATRGVYLKKLERLLHPEKSGAKKSPPRSASSSKSPSRTSRQSIASAPVPSPKAEITAASPPRSASGLRKSAGRTPPRTGRKAHRSESEDAPSDEDRDDYSPPKYQSPLKKQPTSPSPSVRPPIQSPSSPATKPHSPTKSITTRRSTSTTSSIIPGLSNLPTPPIPASSPISGRPMSVKSTVTTRKSTTYSVPSSTPTSGFFSSPTSISTRPAQLSSPPSYQRSPQASLFNNSFGSATSTAGSRSIGGTYGSRSPSTGRLFSDLGHSSADEDPDDDYEGYATSRILFDTPARKTSAWSSYSPASAITKLNDFRKEMWNSLARRFADRAKAIQPTPDRYSLRSSVGRYSGGRGSDTYSSSLGTWNTRTGVESKTSGWGMNENISKILFYFMVGFIFVVLLAYIATARPEAITQAGSHLRGAGKHLKGAANDTMKFFYSYAVLPVIISTILVGLCIAGYYGRIYWVQMREKQNKLRFELVDQIVDIVRDASEDEDDPTVAIPHVRDRLIPALDRHGERLARWNWAVRYINENESRVSTESRLINGVECAVWRWLEPSGKMPPSTMRTRSTGWQGSALTPSQAAKNGPSQPLSQCLKIRGMFNPNGALPVDIFAVEDALRSKLTPIRPLHISVDPISRDGIVYVKLANRMEADRAYRILNGEWLNGQLINVKYLPDARYAERFPLAP